MGATDVVELARQYRAALERLDAKAMSRITEAYAGLYQRVLGDIEALSAAIEKAGQISETQVRRMDAYKRLLRDVEDESSKFGAYLEVELTGAIRANTTTGIRDARGLVALSVDNAPVVMSRYKMLNAEAMIELIGYLDPTGPLFKRLAAFNAIGAERMSQTIFNFVGLGKNPRTLADELRRSFGMNLTDALRISRTAQINAYREANRASYLANEDVVEGWIWYSALDPGRTCMSCVAMHGTFHRNSERLNDHHSGLCTMIPKTITMRGDVVEAGGAWFGNQPPAIQRRMMGAERFEAWQSGRFDLSDLTTETDDDLWGVMRVERSLRDVLAASAVPV